MTSTPLKPSLELGSFSVRPQIVLIGILLLAFALRVARLNFQPLWWDEGYSLFFATRDFATMLDRTALDIHPPLYYVLLHLWTMVAGKSDAALRFFSVVIGTAAIPLLYTLAHRLMNRTIAVIAAFLLAIAPIHVYYSQEVRMYELVTLLGIASVYCFARLLDAPNRTLWIVYILASAAALYTQYYAAFILAFQAFFIIATQFRFRLYALRFWLIAWISIAIVYLPWAIYAGSKLYSYVTLKVGHEAYPSQDPLSFLAQHLVAFSLGHVSALPFLNWAAILFVVLLAFGMYTLFRSPRPAFFSHAVLISLYLLIPLALGYIVNLLYPFHPTRYERLLLLASPPFFILAAAGIAALNRRFIALSAVGLITFFSTLSLYDFYNVVRYPNDDYRPLITQIQTLAQPGDNFLAIYPWQIGYIESYYQGAALNVVETPNDEWIKNPTQMRSEIDALFAKNPRIWIPALQTLGRILEDSLDGDLRPRTYSLVDAVFGSTRLELFAVSDDPPRSAQEVRLDNFAVLQSWGVSNDAVVSGKGVVRVWFNWGPNTPNGLKSSLRLVDLRGNVWMQDDRHIERGVQRIGLALPAGTPPGAYDLRLAVYRENQSTSAIPLATVNIASNQNLLISTIPHRATIEFTNGMRLVGYDSSDKPLKPGEAAGVTLFWQAQEKQNAEYVVGIQIQDALKNTRLDSKDAIALGIYSPSRWLSNELIRDPRTFTLSGDTPDGMYSLAISLIDPTTQARVRTTDGRDSVQLMTVQVKGRPHYFSAPAPSTRSGARFGDVAQLFGYDSIRSGQNLRVVLYWQALGRSEISYKVFLHVLDSTGQLRAQRDQIPGAGAFPTTTWVKGEYLVDVYDITLPNDLSDSQIRIGLYDPAAGSRLFVFDASGKQIADNLTLK